MRTICLYFEIHQIIHLKRYRFFDIGTDHYYYDDYANETSINDVAERSYIPALNTLIEMVKNSGGAFKVAFSITVGSILTHHLIDDVRIGVWEVECIKTLLLLGDAELKFIGIVEKQQSAEQCTLPHSLRTNEMYITIQFHLCIRNMGTVQKNNLIQVSHLAPPPI